MTGARYIGYIVHRFDYQSKKYHCIATWAYNISTDCHHMIIKVDQDWDEREFGWVTLVEFFSQQCFDHLMLILHMCAGLYLPLGMHSLILIEASTQMSPRESTVWVNFGIGESGSLGSESMLIYLIICHMRNLPFWDILQCWDAGVQWELKNKLFIMPKYSH